MPKQEPAPAKIEPPPTPFKPESVPEVKEEIKIPTYSFPTIPAYIKENWMGLFGSLAVVIGAVFFGLTSEIMQLPVARVGTMLAFSLMLWLAHLKLKQNFESLASWLKSIAGAIVLFATLGAGGIDGLQFIQSPVLALAILMAGIGFNLYLAFNAQAQTVVSLHVLLSMAALMTCPQVPLILPLGAIVALVGLYLARRSSWDSHLILIVGGYALLNWRWQVALDDALVFELRLLAIAAAALVGVFAAWIHYNEKYRSPKFESLPFTAHLTNWFLTAWNISMYAFLTQASPFVLGSIAVGGFFLAREAKKRGIIWLYYTDTILAQMMALVAIACLSVFSIQSCDIAILALFEVLISISSATFKRRQP
ncbi:MAG: hypothetical protein LLG04_15625 [Parachlamydia sp.]|nr:hypothetical protein [Parachlamydia sp.]